MLRKCEWRRRWRRIPLSLLICGASSSMEEASPSSHRLADERPLCDFKQVWMQRCSESESKAAGVDLSDGVSSWGRCVRRGQLLWLERLLETARWCGG